MDDRTDHAVRASEKAIQYVYGAATALIMIAVAVFLFFAGFIGRWQYLSGYIVAMCICLGLMAAGCLALAKHLERKRNDQYAKIRMDILSEAGDSLDVV